MPKVDAAAAADDDDDYDNFYDAVS